MRSVLAALGLLITLCAVADAATVHRSKPPPVQLRARQHVIVRPSQSVVVPPGYKFHSYPPIPPEENRNLDPSTFGGTCSGCAGKKRGDGGLVRRDAVKVEH